MGTCELIQSIARWAETTPDTIAVVYGQQALSYAELERCSDALAMRLRAVQDHGLVGVYAERSAELPVMLLATLKAGCAYLPLDPSYPAERLRWMADDAGCRAILVQSALTARIDFAPATPIPVVPTGHDETTYSGMWSTPDCGHAQPAYVLYTSGSTGRPKGVMIGHGALLNHMRWMNRRFPLGTDDRVLQKTPIGFDAAVWEFWAPLMQGARLVMAEPSAHADSAYLAATIEREGITVLQVVPSMLEALLDEDAFCANRTLKRVFCGGEALHRDVVRRFLTHCMPSELVNLYGPTETTIDATYWVCSKEDEGIIAPIGTAIDNVRLFVLDAHGREADAGELCIAGPCVGLGYMNLPKQTAERFVPARDGDGLMYRTGDNVRRLANGVLEFVGRNDHQVKLRGHRIELSEIEAVLKTHPAVAGAVALVADGRLIAVVSGDIDESDAQATVREHAARFLPSYMVPDAVVRLQVLPTLANGKVDRADVAACAKEHMISTDAYNPPRSASERTIAAIWCEVLGLARAGLGWSLFELGGNSLIATRIAARVRKAFSIDLPLVAVFAHPRIEALAARIDAGEYARAADALPRRARDRDRHAPLSYAQERVWMIQQIAPDNLAYAFRTVTRLSGPLDRGALQRALTEIIRRHEIFRTSFGSVDGSPVQVVHSAWTPDLAPVDVSSTRDPQARADRIVEDEFTRSFDITRLPLIRWKLIRLSETEHVLAQTEHHLVHDGWSFNVYLRELKALYEAFANGQPSPLPELTYQFGDYAAWEREWVRIDPGCQAQLDFWRAALRGAPSVLELDISRPRPQWPTYRGALYRVTIPAATSRAVRALCRREDVTLFMAMLAAFKLLLYRHSRATDILVGSGVANRRWLESEQMMGMMLNTVAFRTDLGGDPAFSDLLARVKRSTLATYAHQDVPFQCVVQASCAPRDVSHNPIVQVMFNFHDAPLPSLEMAGVRAEVNDLMDNGSAKFDISLIAIPRLERSVGVDAGQDDETIPVIWEFNTDLFDRVSIEALACTYVDWLDALARDPQLRPSDLAPRAASRPADIAINARLPHPTSHPPAREEFRL